MKQNKSSKFANLLSFIDLLFNLMLGFAAMFLLSLQMMSPILKNIKESIPKEAEYVLRIEWQGDSDHDVDLWIQHDLTEEISGFTRISTATMHLERDNTGNDSNRKEPGHINEELISIRQTQAGWYTVNLHWYADRTSTEAPIVKWSLMKMKPSMQTVASGTARLTKRGQELTILRFMLDANGKLIKQDINSQVSVITKSQAKAQ